MTDPIPDAATAIRDAASLVLLRPLAGGSVGVLMGQRGEGARFMPSKTVFPGGALDPSDRVEAERLAALAGARPAASCAARLERASVAGLGPGLALAAVRETFEETGLRLGRREAAPGASVDPRWRRFAEGDVRPAPERLRFVFRAITPPGRSRRFDARFFLGLAQDLLDPPDDFSRADGELARLAWTPLADARRLELPFVTHLVLAEVAAAVGALGLDGLAALGPDDPWPRAVPFFRTDEEEGARVDPL